MTCQYCNQKEATTYVHVGKVTLDVCEDCRATVRRQLKADEKKEGK